MIPVTSFAYAAGMLVVAGVYALWRSDDATAAGWGITATCGGVAILAAAYARWWGVEEGHTLAVAASLAGLMIRVGMADSEAESAPDSRSSEVDDGGEGGDVEAAPAPAEEVEYGP